MSLYALLQEGYQLLESTIVWSVHYQLQLTMRAKVVLSQGMAAEAVEKLEAASD